MAKLAAAKKPPADPADALLLHQRGARQAALKLLARRDFSSGELQKRLAERGFNAEVLAALIPALKQQRLLDDTRFIEHFTAYQVGRGQGPIRIRRELQRQGLDTEQIDAFLAGDSGDAIDWLALAQDLRRRKFGAGLPKSNAEKAKQARFLQYRGFTGAQIRAALDTNLDLNLDDT